MITKIQQLKNVTELSIMHLKSTHGGTEEEEFCSDEWRSFVLGCDNF